MNVILGAVQAHLIQPRSEPLQELVLHQGGEGASVVRDDKDVVCRGGGGCHGWRGDVLGPGLDNTESLGRPPKVSHVLALDSVWSWTR